MRDIRFVHDDRLSRYQLADDHPFKPVRLELTRTLLEATGLLDADRISPVEPIDETRLERVHAAAYIEAVKAASAGREMPDAYGFGLGTGDNPVFAGMHEAVLGVCAATVQAVDLVASGRAQRAVNLSGGLHHALRDKASGFCIYNDLALGIDHALIDYGLRVAYIDVDAHHGDGVQWMFYQDPRVMTVSLHESGRYLFPGTGHTYEIGKGEGRGLSVNAPLEPFTEDDSFLEVFDAVVPRALEVFRPDLIVLQAGADMHRLDPLADLALSLHGMKASYQRVSELADRYCNGRLVATGGGGYDPYRTVPRAWGQLWAVLSGQSMPATLPRAWLDAWQERSPDPLPSASLDDPDAWTPMPRRKQITSHNRVVAQRLIDTLEPVWRERSDAAGTSQSSER